MAGGHNSNNMPPFDRWTYLGRDPDTHMPWITLLLHRVCDNDQAKFEEALRILRAAFAAGQQAGPKG